MLDQLVLLIKRLFALATTTQIFYMSSEEIFVSPKMGCMVHAIQVELISWTSLDSYLYFEFITIVAMFAGCSLLFVKHSFIMKKKLFAIRNCEKKVPTPLQFEWGLSMHNMCNGGI